MTFARFANRMKEIGTRSIARIKALWATYLRAARLWRPAYTPTANEQGIEGAPHGVLGALHGEKGKGEWNHQGAPHGIKGALHGKKGGRPKGSKNKPGHKAGRPKGSKDKTPRRSRRKASSCRSVGFGGVPMPPPPPVPQIPPAEWVCTDLHEPTEYWGIPS